MLLRLPWPLAAASTCTRTCGRTTSLPYLPNLSMRYSYSKPDGYCRKFQVESSAWEHANKGDIDEAALVAVLKDLKQNVRLLFCQLSHKFARTPSSPPNLNAISFSPPAKTANRSSKRTRTTLSVDRSPSRRCAR